MTTILPASQGARTGLSQAVQASEQNHSGGPAWLLCYSKGDRGHSTTRAGKRVAGSASRHPKGQSAHIQAHVTHTFNKYPFAHSHVHTHIHIDHIKTVTHAHSHRLTSMQTHKLIRAHAHIIHIHTNCHTHTHTLIRPCSGHVACGHQHLANRTHKWWC